MNQTLEHRHPRRQRPPSPSPSVKSVTSGGGFQNPVLATPPTALAASARIGWPDRFASRVRCDPEKELPRASVAPRDRAVSRSTPRTRACSSASTSRRHTALGPTQRARALHASPAGSSTVCSPMAAQEERSQLRNREIARERLEEVPRPTRSLRRRGRAALPSRANERWNEGSPRRSAAPRRRSSAASTEE